jgi:hypothetical protein
VKIYKRIVVLILISIFSLVAIGCNPDNSIGGSISLRIKNPDRQDESEIIVLDGQGNHLDFVGKYSGSPTWSHSGRMLAVGCSDGICILDMSTLPRINRDEGEMGMMNSHPKVLYTLSASPLCQEVYTYGAGNSYSGILSMSWSPDDLSIAAVCGSEKPDDQRSLCIYKTNGTKQCWADENVKDILRIGWSPTDPNLLVVAGLPYVNHKSSIYLVDSEGNGRTFIAEGWSPAWSPDGKTIAYLNATPDHLGIWYFELEEQKISSQPITSKQPLSFDCSGFTGTCRISWSPDQKYIVFASSTYGVGIHLFRVNRQTGELFQLVDDRIISYPSEPDWGAGK